jgi:hypothetical protein
VGRRASSELWQGGVAVALLVGVVLVARMSTRMPPITAPPQHPQAVALTASPYHEVAQLPLSLKRPYALSANGDWIAVAGDSAIWRGRIQAPAAGTTLSLSSSPQCLQLQADGALLVGFQASVTHYHAKGQPRSWAIPGQKAHLTAVAAGHGRYFAADAGQRVVWMFDKTGKSLGTLGKPDAGKNYPGLRVPSPYLDLVVDPQGIWVVNPGHHRLELFSLDGRILKSWGKASFAPEGFSGCCNPSHLARLPDGRFITSEKGARQVKLFSTAGQFEALVAGPEAFSPQAKVLDVAVDGHGRILVLDPSARAVRIFEKKK